MNLSPTFVETDTEPFLSDVDLTILLFSFMVIGTAAFLIRARTSASIVVVFFWPAVMFGIYVIVLVGFSWPLFLIFLMIVISAIAIWQGLKGEKMFPHLAAIAIIGAFFLVVTFLGGGGEMISEEIGGNGEGIFIPWDDPGGYMETTFGNFGTLLLIILVGGILAFLLVQRVIPMISSSTESEEDEEKLEDQLSSTVDSAVTELREGKDVHSTILRCYQKMCLILEEEGAKNFDFMTPREFEKQAMRTLDVSTSKITEIREVFELAKYSNYRLGDEERDRALKSLKELRKELR
ncbi:MAG: DUF4129 domain-containing protein [Candidatus Thermoplasmatota archaeon]|nr:DUF4129 domain-containing protein [Candidatus Thermoplasmatota archaeon]MBS3789952.1 DUF4129 domain-containing protein [Candidatus Thermoplasmatota archaeon]